VALIPEEPLNALFKTWVAMQAQQINVDLLRLHGHPGCCKQNGKVLFHNDACLVFDYRENCLPVTLCQHIIIFT
jgi:hypothetical protein